MQLYRRWQKRLRRAQEAGNADREETAVRRLEQVSALLAVLKRQELRLWNGRH
jgi:hypothetical protein